MDTKDDGIVMVIERAGESALRALDASPEALADLREGRAFAYVVTVEADPHGDGTDREPLGGPGLCLLDKPWWAGVYTVEAIDRRCPGLDANWLADVFEGVLRSWRGQS